MVSAVELRLIATTRQGRPPSCLFGRGSYSVASQLRRRRAPAVPDFSGWNWVDQTRPHSTPATKSYASWLAQVTVAPPEGRRGQGRVRVDEVEALVAHAGEHGRPVVRRDLVPAHVRQPYSRQLRHEPGIDTHAVDDGAVLVAVREQDLVADADAQDRTVLLHATPDDAVAAHAEQALHAGRERADTGHDEAVRLGRDVGIGGEYDLGARLGERPRGRVQVPRPVVEDRHAGTRHRAPFVDGTPVTLGSGSTRRAARGPAPCTGPRRCGAGRGPTGA
jgi:hypothetical protein